MHNPDPAQQAKIDEAKAKRQRAIEYGNNALKATTKEAQLRDLKKQARNASGENEETRKRLVMMMAEHARMHAYTRNDTKTVCGRIQAKY